MYKYETHLHTTQSSNCASATAKQQVDYYKSKGYTAICVTDHFVTGVENQSWEERVSHQALGYEEAKKYAIQAELDVFYGFEYTNCAHPGLDILCYGLDKAFLLAHPEIDSMSVNEFCVFAKENGAVLVHAHPFREAGYIPMICLLPRMVQAVEINNANRTDFENDMAKKYAENYSLCVSAGSDNHTAEKQQHLCGVISDIRFTSALEMANAIIDRKVKLF